MSVDIEFYEELAALLKKYNANLKYPTRARDVIITSDDVKWHYDYMTDDISLPDATKCVIEGVEITTDKRRMLILSYLETLFCKDELEESNVNENGYVIANNRYHQYKIELSDFDNEMANDFDNEMAKYLKTF